MKQKCNLLPWLTLVAGILGAGLCLLFSRIGVDDRGLLPATHPIPILLAILTVGAFTMLFFGLRGITNSLPYGKLFPKKALTAAGCLIGGIGILAGSILTPVQSNSWIAIATSLCSVFAAASLLLVGWIHLNHMRPHFIFHAVVSIYFMLLLIASYQTWSTKPQFIIYLPRMLALIFLMISAYYRAALDAEMGKRRSFSFFNLGALFFCCMAAISSQWIFYLCMAAFTFICQCSLVRQPAVIPMALPEEVLYCIDTLTDAGYEAYCVGGCVRDHLLGLTPSDYDLCTSATPEQICQLFATHELVHSGEKHGTVGVVLAGQMYEITTFRKEGDYSDARHPDWVEFVTDINQDLARRDFTVNAIAYAPGIGYVDPFDGQKDLLAKTLKAVGDPQRRFQEDALRILRGVRFSVRFGLMPEAQTLEAMHQCAPLMDHLAKERIYAEIHKLLPLITTDQLLDYKAVFARIFPALLENNGDSFEAAAQVTGMVSGTLALRFAALLYPLGAKNADSILQDLRAPNAVRNRAVLLIELCSSPLEPDKKLLRQVMGQYGKETLQQLICLQKAIAVYTGKETDGLDMAELLLNTIDRDGSCLTVKDLAITGADLLALGVDPGPRIGRCMQSLLSLVQEDLLANDRNELLDAAKSFLLEE